MHVTLCFDDGAGAENLGVRRQVTLTGGLQRLQSIISNTASLFCAKPRRRGITSSPSQGADPKARILTLGSYPPTLKTWHMLLEAPGYQAVSFVVKNGCGDLKNGSGDLFKQGPFDVIILGQSVDDAKKGSLRILHRRNSILGIGFNR